MENPDRVFLMSYSWESDDGRKEEGVITCLISGRQCAFVVLYSSVPNPNSFGVRAAVCSYLGIQNVASLIFYHLQAFQSKTGGPHWLLPDAERIYFHLEPDGTLDETATLKIRLKEQASLVQAVMAYLYRTDLAVVLDKILAQKSD